MASRRTKREKSENTALQKELKTIDVFSIAAGAMISSGLFILPSILYKDLGSIMIMCYFLAGIVYIPSIFSNIELATAMPKAGGSYFFIERSLGSIFGTIGGLSTWLSLSFKSAFSFFGIGVFISFLFPQIANNIKIIALISCIILTLINLFKIKISSTLQNVLVFSIISILTIYLAIGITKINPQYLLHSKSFSFGALIYGVESVFISYLGLTKATSISEEIKNPTKTIKNGMLSSFFVIWVLYTLSIIVTVGVLQPGEFDKTLVPLSTSALKIMGVPGEVLLTIAGILAVLTTGNAGIMAAARFPLALSRDKLLPSFLSYVSPKTHIPTLSVITTGIIIAVSIYFLDIESLVKVAGAFVILEFIFVNTSLIVMRESKILNYKPSFVSPLYPWLQILGIIAYIFILSQLGTKIIIGMASFIVIAILWHFIYKKEFTTRKSAIIHIIERITDKEIADPSLTKELTEILKERDEIIEDRFDKLIKNAIIIDIKESITLEEFFKIASQKLGDKLEVEPEYIYQKLLKREKETTTEIRPGLAVPHITIEGEKKFDMLIARCEEGILFTRDLPPVYAVFVLIGTRDERTFHLKALSSIAQIIQNPDFDKHWLRAINEESLRYLILAAERIRDVYKSGK